MAVERTIEADDDGIRLDRWFKRHMPLVGNGLLQKALRKGQARLGGKKAEANSRIVAGQIITFPDEWMELAETPTQSRPKTEKVPAGVIKDIEKCIIYEDDKIIVLNKPAGLAVQGGTGQHHSVDSILMARAGGTRETAPKLVHRIDRDTSGILILAKTAKEASELANAFAKKKVQKYYWALIAGLPDVKAGEIDLPIIKKEQGPLSRMERVVYDEDEGKYALTRYRVVEHAARKLSWVEMEPVTGRTHQLRVHMASIGYPILGDGKYGGTDAFISGGEVSKELHLHARRIELDLPSRKLQFEAPLPPHMKASWKLFNFDEPSVRNPRSKI